MVCLSFSLLSYFITSTPRQVAYTSIRQPAWCDSSSTTCSATLESEREQTYQSSSLLMQCTINGILWGIMQVVPQHVLVPTSIPPLDPTQVFDQTWHTVTMNPSDPPTNITATFTGMLHTIVASASHRYHLTTAC